MSFTKWEMDAVQLKVEASDRMLFDNQFSIINKKANMVWWWIPLMIQKQVTVRNCRKWLLMQRTGENFTNASAQSSNRMALGSLNLSDIIKCQQVKVRSPISSTSDVLLQRQGCRCFYSHSQFYVGMCEHVSAVHTLPTSGIITVCSG